MGTGHLKIFFGEEQEDKVFVLEEGKSYKIGRSKDAEIRLKDIKVSREHCEVKVEGDKHVIKDLGSRNGTYLNGERVEEVVVQAGDRLKVGPLMFVFQIDGQPEKIDMPKPAGQKSHQKTRPADRSPDDDFASFPELDDLDTSGGSDLSEGLDSLEQDDSI